MKHPISEFLKKLGLAAMLTIMPVAAFSQAKTVILLGRDGSTYELELNEVDRINFNPQTVEMRSTSGAEKSMAYADIDRISIGEALSGIYNLTDNGKIAIYPSVTTGPLNIAGAEAGTEISVFDLNGILIKQTRATDSTLTLDISDATNGMVIVRIGNHSVKIIKK